jgi:hypothetical protein
VHLHLHKRRASFGEFTFVRTIYDFALTATAVAVMATAADTWTTDYPEA